MVAFIKLPHTASDDTQRSVIKQSGAPVSQPLPEEQNEVTPRRRDKRGGNFWEPIFDPSDTGVFPFQDWPTQEGERREHGTLSVAQLTKKPDDKVVFNAVTFSRSDFEGDFTDYTPTFKFTIFEHCDFGFSKWRRAKFKNCTFLRCSFSIASFEECEFRNCRFTEIGLSGNETYLQGSLFTEPEEFVSSAYTCTDERTLKLKKTTIDYQLMRLQGTKATIARIILHNSATNGDEEIYYRCVKLYQNISIDSKMILARYNLSEKPGLDKAVPEIVRLTTLGCEKLIINTVGWLNNWGASIAKPAFVGVALIMGFTFLYWMTAIRTTFLGALSASIDIGLLIGYTKHASNSLTMGTKFIFILNMILGLVWYSVFLPTVVNRISRIR